MNKPQDYPGIIQDISLLYELALSIGHSMDLKTTCDVFLKTLMARKNLDDAAVWLKNSALAQDDEDEGMQLIYANPRFRKRETRLAAQHPLLRVLETKEAFSLSSTDEQFEAMTTEAELHRGTFAVFALNPIGFLRLHSSVRAQPFAPWELNKLQNVMAKFAVSLQGCLDHQRLREQIHERKRSEEKMLASLREKEILLKEIHHRVKNNMQIVSSLLNLQSGYIQDPSVLTLFKESDNRIRTMALIHEQLYQSTNLASIDFQAYVPTLTDYLRSSYSNLSHAVTLKLELEPITLGIDTAIPCGLIINELVSNAFKHAFRGMRSGELHITLRRRHAAAATNTSPSLVLSIRDNGVGFPADIDFRQTKSLGLKLVVSLVRQIKGTITKNEHHGTEFIIMLQEQ